MKLKGLRSKYGPLFAPSMVAVRWTRKSGYWELKYVMTEGGVGVLRRGGGGTGEVWNWGRDAQRLPRSAPTERPGVRMWPCAAISAVVVDWEKLGVSA